MTTWPKTVAEPQVPAAPELVPQDLRPVETVSASRATAEAWVRNYYKLVYGRAFLVLRNPDEAADCCQAVFEKVSGLGQRLNSIDNPEAWLRTVTHNHALNMVRRARRDRSLLERLPVSPESVADEDPRLRRLFVHKVLEELSDEDRQLVICRYYEGRTDREIADIVGVRTGTVKSRLNRIRKSIAKAMAGWEE